MSEAPAMRGSPIRKAYWNAFTLWHVRGEARLPFRPVEEITAIQNRRVRRIVAHAYDSVQHYRDVMDAAGMHPRDLRTADDLARLPILTSAEIARDPSRFLSRHYANGRALRLHSSGTSGFSKPIYYDAAALFLTLAHGHRQRHVIARFVGRKFGYREMRLAREGGLPFQIRAFYEANSWVPRKVDLERSHASPGERFEETIARWNAFKPEVVHGYGAHVGALFRHAAQHGLALHRPFCVTYGADRMSEADRALIENDFGVPIVSTYQAAEALRLGFQCEERKAFHMSIDHTAVRVVNSGGQPVAPGGTGEIVISNLVNRATVLLNYKLGDVVSLPAAACACGRTLPTIGSIDGRADDFLFLEGGHKVHALVALPPLLRVDGVVQVQLTQNDTHRFSVRVVCARDREWERVRHDLAAALRSTLGEALVIEIERTETIAPEASGKFKSVISHCRAS
ncbi:MAG: phenylacetate--CoA ligase family protein [Anaerolineae bacterium]|nr:phenylacetate--CoA ligase family protein [Gemmatimonadaceae bacterium]